jgi:hypothetical protein
MSEDVSDSKKTWATDLRSALRKAADVVASERTLQNALKLVGGGIWMQLKISVSQDNDGKFRVSVQSGTRGTTVNIMLIRDLLGEAEAVADWAAAKAAVLGVKTDKTDRTEPVLAKDPRWKRDFD